MIFIKKILLIVFLIELQNSNFIFAQINSSQIEQFENNLSTDIQIKDSAIAKFNIYDRMKFRKVPAVSVSAIKKGEIILNKSYGNANIKKNTKADSNTLFHFASISKTVNALCILKLVEEGKLALTDDFRLYIKDESFKENKFSKGLKITIANLLSHTAGINRDDGPSGDYTYDKPLPTITQIVKGEKPALGNGAYSIRKPNEDYEYSNQAICILQKILTDNFDADYNSLITNTVFNPLRMTHSSFALKLDAKKEERLSKGYVFDYQVVPQWVFPCQAQGGLIATTSDIAKMVIAMQNSFNQKDTTFLKKASIEKMFSPQLNDISYTGNLNVPYKNGLGVMLFQKGGKQYFTHTGSIDGYTSIYIGSLDGVDGAVIMINSSNAGIITELINSIATTFNWQNFIDYKYQIAINPKQKALNQYIGNYKLTSSKKEFTFTITQNNNQLFIQNTNDGTSEKLFFSSDNTAFVLSRSYTIEFSDKKNSIIVKNNREFSGEAIKIN
jgi:CubicO group peptidase (beta-lactamase class C family)